MKKIFLLFALVIFKSGFSQEPVTDANFHDAIQLCLLYSPVTGLCTNSLWGEMPDWDVSGVTDMRYAFEGRPDFNADIGGWDVSNVNTMEGMFYEVESFNQNIDSWDVSSVIDMSYMFAKNRLSITMTFNQPIGNWNVSSVSSGSSMGSMFQSAAAFVQDISGWCVSQISN